MSIFLRIEQLVHPIPIYHVALKHKNKRYDFHPKNIKIPQWTNNRMKNCPNCEVYVGESEKTQVEIESFINKSKKTYMFPIYDCRHYTQELLDFTCVNTLNVINPCKLHNLFETHKNI